MKAVMISIQPKWCELIANDEKTIEVRKTRPKIDTPFKCYIYCTGGRILVDNESMIYRQSKTRLIKREINKEWFKVLLDYGGNYSIYDGDYELNGKVIGEFVCNKVEKFTVGTLRCDDIEKAACLTYAQMIDYFYKPNELDGNTAKFGYAWYITDLKIYDKPKDLGEFRSISSYCEYQKKYRIERCEKCDKINVACIQYNCECWTNKNGKAIIKDRRITQPPQSWQYCEELEEK